MRRKAFFFFLFFSSPRTPLRRSPSTAFSFRRALSLPLSFFFLFTPLFSLPVGRSLRM